MVEVIALSFFVCVEAQGKRDVRVQRWAVGVGVSVVRPAAPPHAPCAPG